MICQAGKAKGPDRGAGTVFAFNAGTYQSIKDYDLIGFLPCQYDFQSGSHQEHRSSPLTCQFELQRGCRKNDILPIWVTLFFSELFKHPSPS